MARYIDADKILYPVDKRETGKTDWHRGVLYMKDTIDRQPTADVEEVKNREWIPVTDRLPKCRRDYLCICVFGASKMQFYNVLKFHPEENAENGYVTGPHFSNEGMNDMRVTHWMQLPKPPCGAKMDGGKEE